MSERGAEEWKELDLGGLGQEMPVRVAWRGKEEGRGRCDAIIVEDRYLYLDGCARGEEEGIRVRMLVTLERIRGPAIVALCSDQRVEYYAPELSHLLRLQKSIP